MVRCSRCSYAARSCHCMHYDILSVVWNGTTAGCSAIMMVPGHAYILWEQGACRGPSRTLCWPLPRLHAYLWLIGQWWMAQQVLVLATPILCTPGE